jgi:aspartate-semialdehyde dehydrogenase
MARPSAEPATARIAVLGAAAPLGAHLRAALADRGVSGARVTLFGRRSSVAVISEYDGEARLVQSSDEFDATVCDAVFVCERGHDGADLASAAAGGTFIIDMTGSVPGAVLAAAAGVAARERIVAVAHPVATMLAALLDPVHRAIGVTRVSAFVLRPASDFGEPGLEELREQTVHLLRFEPTPTDVFGRQLAFNVVPEHLFPAGEDETSIRVAHEVRAMLRAAELPLAVSQALVPTFYGHAIAAHIELARPGRAEALAAWRAASGLDVASDPEVGATLDAPDRPALVIARVDADPGSALRVWAIGSEAGPVAAASAVEAAAAAGVL